MIGVATHSTLIIGRAGGVSTGVWAGDLRKPDIGAEHVCLDSGQDAQDEDEMGSSAGRLIRRPRGVCVLFV